MLSEASIMRSSRQMCLTLRSELTCCRSPSSPASRENSGRRQSTIHHRFQPECRTMHVQKPLSKSPRQLATSETLKIRPLLLKPQWMNGLSERLLVSHYENNYGGALRRLNAIRARIASLDWARTAAFEINGLKR